MVRRLIVGAVLCCGLFLVAQGILRWQDARAAEKAVTEYLEALRSGDRAALLESLAPARRAKFEARERDGLRPVDFAVTDTGWTYRIRRVELDPHASPRTAVAGILIERDGFRIEPRLHLRREPGRGWKVSGVEPIAGDPLWAEIERRRAFEANERLADELREAFADHPGVVVERFSDGDGRR